ncbi:hypothetical protein CAPTEDRAFT_218384 [Capitella teleta]|uniref:Nocturnin n=1 Tax=Capitella teleta TaxID=283909 RepID=R7VDM9_CAPTE|nr:hypothetical protein CAPTEDRAFT_218384 [Capitella teleta]|eukprot:ELU13780.1 hypothetical protein CAPTEDRAFT_218384 [Capitella teleta]
MQWNILAQALSVGKDNFVKCPHDALSWDIRRLRIIESILDVLPDILCLQEVDHYLFLEEVLSTVGYVGNFCPKPDSPCLYTDNSNGPDGCAAFYRSDKFEEIQRHNFVLRADGTETNQVCATVTLKCKSSGKSFSVGVTHLKAKYGWDDLRHKQGVYMLSYLHKNLPASSALILCGDFNAEPTEQVHKACLESPLGLKSAYAVNSENGIMEPAYTTWKIRGGATEEEDVEVCRTIDYIWYTEKSLKVTALKEFPTGDEIGAERVPSYAYPSDHFSLAADFKFL